MPTISKTQAHASHTPQVHGTHVYLRPIQVTPAGSPGFSIGINGLAVRADIPPEGATSVSVHVASPLAFDGTAHFDVVPFQLARAADVADGRMRVTAGVPVRVPRATAAGVTADVVLAPGVVVRDVLVSEGLLTLDFAPRVPGAAAGGAGSRRARGSTVHLHGMDGRYAPLTIEVSTPLGLVFAERGDARDGLLPVEARWSDGRALIGRVNVAELQEINSSETFAVGHIEEGAPGEAWCGVRSTPPGMSRGVRRIRADTVVYAEPGRGAWARVVEPVDLEIEYAPDALYAAVVAMPGVVELRDGCAENVHAWIDVGTLSGAERAR